MNRLISFAALSLSVTMVTIPSFAQTVAPSKPPTCKSMSLGVNASLNGFVPFHANDPWRQNVTNSPIDPNSAQILATIGGGSRLHPDFGSSAPGDGIIGIPYQVVASTQTPMAAITYTAYGAQSDQGPMPIPVNAPIEGMPNLGQGGDQHVLILDRDKCFLYELFNTSIAANGQVSADSGAIFDLVSNNARPWGWTSADAAGLPVFPGLARYDEVAAGAIKHALRFTLNHTTYAAIFPAKHIAGSTGLPNTAPMGMRIRLKPSFDISGFPPQSQVVLQALKTYGMIVADNGSSGYISGAPNDGWNNDDLHALGQVTLNNFDVLNEGTVYTSSTYPTGPAPTIQTFLATASSKPGARVELTWKVTGGSYYVVSPAVGPSRAEAAYVNPRVTTTYTLYATNQYGQNTATVTVVVP